MNINNIDDPFYRYKRSCFEIESRGKKTIIKNFNEICNQINQKTSLVIKFFRKFNSTAVKINKNNHLVMNGIMSIERLNECLQNFIDHYVLCPSCNNPETVVTKTQTGIKFTCNACGTVNVKKCNNKYDTIIYNNL